MMASRVNFVLFLLSQHFFATVAFFEVLWVLQFMVGPMSTIINFWPKNLVFIPQKIFD